MIWPTVSLDAVCGFQNGFAFKSSRFTEQGTPILRISNIQSGSIDLKKIVYTDPEQYKENLDRYTVSDGDLLIAMSGATTGKIGINDSGIEFLLNQRVGKFLPKKELDKCYLYYYLSTKVEEHLSVSAGAAQPNLSTEQIKAIAIPLPPVQEQKRIVAILDQAFADIEQARAKTEQNLKSARELFKSYLQQVFSRRGEGWVEDEMNTACELITCGVAATPKYVDEDVGVPFLSAQNVKKGRVTLHKYRYISRDLHADLTKKNKPQKGDILYSRVGAGFGEAAVVDHDFEFSVYVSLTLIKPKPKKLNNYYLKHYLNSPAIKLLARQSITSSGVPNLNVKTVRHFPIAYPSLDRQGDIVEKIHSVEKEVLELVALYERKMSSLDELKKSILQKAFTGQLTAKQAA